MMGRDPKLKAVWANFRAEPIASVARWQETRPPWILLAVVSLFLLTLAHSVFQVWLYMKPCEHCVYIRFAFLCVMIGGVVAAIDPKIVVLRLIGYLLVFGGAIKGVDYCLKLNKIHRAIRSDNPFGVQGCSPDPTFPFGAPLDRWLPEWFKPTGDCGVDSPIVPDNVTLSGLQRWLVDCYADGWYLWPPAHFLNMAQVCLIIFASIVLFLAIAALSWLITFRRSTTQSPPPR